MARRSVIQSFLWSGLLGLGGLSLQASPDDQDGRSEDGFRALFNGENLEGFTTWLRASKREDPLDVFSVEDGSLRISGAGYGYLATLEEFENFHLKLAFRWGDQEGLERGERKGKALDSGVFLRATGPDGNSEDGDGAFMAAIECNLFEGASGDFLLIRGRDADGQLIVPRVAVKASPERDRDGFPFWEAEGETVNLETWGRVNWKGKSRAWEDVRGFRGANDMEKPAGQWNELECRCADGEITVRLNGVLVNQVRQAWPRRGKILLQCEGAEIHFREVRVKELAD